MAISSGFIFAYKGGATHSANCSEKEKAAALAAWKKYLANPQVNPVIELKTDDGKGDIVLIADQIAGLWVRGPT